MTVHCCIGSPCWLCHPTHVNERGGFYDLGKLETALVQRDELAKALKIFLGHDERFQVAVGGNPNAVEKMLDHARNLCAAVNPSPQANASPND